jgi:hypothetical protein
MKVDTRSFPGVNMVESHRDVGERSAQHRLDFTFDINIGLRKAKGNTSLKSR